MNDAVKVIGGVVGGLTLIGLFGIAIAPDEDVIGKQPSISQKASNPIETATEPYVEEPVIELTEADEFISCVNSSGLDVEKNAVKHVTKVSGTHEFDGTLDMPEVYTDFNGDMFSEEANTANVIASAFKSCYEDQSDNGLVSIYSQNGEFMTLENF